MNAPLVSVLALALLSTTLAGCIELPSQTNDAAGGVSSQDPPSRTGRMTASERMTDSVAACESGGGRCAQRRITIEGEFGLSSIETIAKTFNGPITLRGGAEGEWNLEAILRAKGSTDAEAKDNLNLIEWKFSHSDGRGHFLRAEAKRKASATDLFSSGGDKGLGASIQLVVPRSVVHDLTASSSNGPVTVSGAKTTAISIETSNGPITIEAEVRNVNLRTSNGPITARLTPTASGQVTLGTSNGPITLDVTEDSRRGYDINAETSNGSITIRLDDGAFTTNERNHKQWRSSSYDARSVKTRVGIETSNGPITVTG